VLDHRSPQAAYDSLPARDRPAVVIERFHRCARGSLVGYADVAIPSDRVVIRSIAVHQIGDWISIRLPEATARMFFCVPPRYLDERGARQFEREVIAALRTHRHALAGRERGP
jgi:hypothetical protein